MNNKSYKEGSLELEAGKGNNNLIQLWLLRRNNVKETGQAYRLVIEANELVNWIHMNEKHTTNQDLSCDSELLIGEFYALQTDPKLNKAKPVEMDVI